MTKKQKLKIVDEAIRLIEIGKRGFSCAALNTALNESSYEEWLRFMSDFESIFLFVDEEYIESFSEGDNCGLDYQPYTELGKRTRLIALELFKCMIEDGSV